MILIWFSGVIRGAVAFALSLQISKKISPNASLMVSSTLVVVLTTTLLFGGLMSIFTKFIGINREIKAKTYSKLQSEGTSMIASHNNNKPLRYEFEED